MKWLGAPWSMFIVITISTAIVYQGEDAKAAFTLGKATNLGPNINSPDNEASPFISADGLTLYWGSYVVWGGGDLWFSTRSSYDEPWGPKVGLGPLVNSAYGDGFPVISDNGLTLYFASNRPGSYGWLDIYVTTRPTVDAPWSEPINLGPPINDIDAQDGHSISPDGLTMHFVSCAKWPGSQGGCDIWVTTRPSITDAWGPPINLGPVVNSSVQDWTTCLSRDGNWMFFGSVRPDGTSESDIWVTRRRSLESPWEPPIKLGPNVNTVHGEATPHITADATALLFWSDRPGGMGGWDIWQVPILPVVDFNGDYEVDIDDLVILTDYWRQNKDSVDIGPTPFGDGIVDAADLEVLMSYWGQEVYDPHLLARWKMDESEGEIAFDSVADSDGVVNGEVVWLSENGRIDGALLCDGITTYVDAPFVLDPEDGPLSVFAWINGGASGQVIISQSQGMDWLAVDAEQGFLRTNLTSVSRGKVGPPLVSSAVITDSNWHRLGVVWDGTRRILYVDDVEVGRDESDNLAPGEGGLIIGAGAERDDGSFFSGLIDDVRIYDRAVEP